MLRKTQFWLVAMAVVLALPRSARWLVLTCLSNYADSQWCVNVPPAGGLGVDIGGSLSIANTVAPGTNPVVTYDGNGLITAGRALQPSDLPAPSGGELGAVKAGPGSTLLLTARFHRR